MDAVQALRQAVEHRLYPELERIAPQHRGLAKERARAESFDLIEIACILGAMAAVTYMTRYGLAGAQPAHRVLAAVTNFAVAIPQLAVLAGPFLVRRTRRGLRAYLAEQGRRP